MARMKALELDHLSVQVMVLWLIDAEHLNKIDRSPIYMLEYPYIECRIL